MKKYELTTESITFLEDKEQLKYRRECLSIIETVKIHFDSEA